MDFTCDEIRAILDKAKEIKAEPKKYSEALKGKVLAMIFEKPSLRTRVTFEVGMFQMGGHAIYLSPTDAQLGKRESVPDIARNLERWVNVIMARTFAHDSVTGLAKYANIPVINGLSDLLHPCQAMADYLTILEVYGGFKGKKISYIGDGNNVAHSLVNAAAKLGMNISVVTPKGYEPNKEMISKANEVAKKTGSVISIVNDPKEGLSDSDVVYTDVWASMGQESEALARKKIFKDYQVNKRVMSFAKNEAIFMHCLPAHRGDEVTDEVADSDRSVIFQQAENRLHAQKAVMYLIAGS